MSAEPVGALAKSGRETQSKKRHHNDGAEPGLRVFAVAFALLLLVAAVAVLGKVSGWDFTRAQRTAAPATTNPNIGRSRMPLPDGKTCREIMFNRFTGHIIESTDGPCALPPATRRTPGDFVWGGK